MVRELLNRIHAVPSVVWGGHVPPNPSTRAARDAPARRVRIVVDSKSTVATTMARDITSTLAKVAPKWQASAEGDVSSASHILVLLTGGVLAHGSTSFSELVDVISTRKFAELVFVYLESGPDAWDWGLPSKIRIEDPELKDRVQNSICGHEAYKYRPAIPAPLYYEHEALVLDICGRIGIEAYDVTKVSSSEAKVEHTIAGNGTAACDDDAGIHQGMHIHNHHDSEPSFVPRTSASSNTCSLAEPPSLVPRMSASSTRNTSLFQTGRSSARVVPL